MAKKQVTKKEVVKEKIGKKSGKAKHPGIENLTPGGPGRPKGQRNFKTIYRDALVKLAALNKVKPEDLEDDMIQMAIAKARKGDSVFYKDVMDRIHGKAIQPIGGADGGAIKIVFDSSFNKGEDETPQETKRDS